jgi:hypothetical protein|nr:MAG TPA: hypothetical protein [Microviridae sp.]
MHKTWNVRDQTKEALEEMLTRKYKEIDGEYKMLRKISNVEDAKKMLDEIWRMKSFANAIEMELVRREYTNGTTS